jgi:glycosyltransferase involved in cell wall biosynthesis
MRYLFVVPRFGVGAVGGAERLAHQLATRALGDEDEAMIATTCAVDHHTWENALPAGTATEDGLTVHRFRVGPRDAQRFAQLHHTLVSTGGLSYADELEFLSQSVWSLDLQTFLRDEGHRFDLIFFIPYLFGTTYWGMQVHPERSVLIPCLHDEPYAYMRSVHDMVEASAGCLFNTSAEKRLAESLYHLPQSAVVGLGFDAYTRQAPLGFAERHGLGRYLVYVGRLEEGKGVGVAAEHVAQFARKHAPDLRLVLVGSGPYRPSRRIAPFVHHAGWLTEDEKRSAIAGAIALVNPSRMESLSIVLMESWLEKVPVLVSSQSDVLREHIESSNGGLCFGDYGEFVSGLRRLLESPDDRAHLGAAGLHYVESTMSWPRVRERFTAATRAIVSTTSR